MPRGRRKASTPEEQLTNIITEIEQTENKLKDLKEKRKNLENQIEKQQLAEIRDLITESGKSVEQVKEMLQKQQ
jgi:septal ring factor EnvC (AmiA/AmiB activator)